MYLRENKENVIAVVWKILRHYGVKVTYETVLEYFKTNPGKLSLNDICDFFDYLNITNYALEINKSDLFEFNGPLIAYVNKNGWELLLIHSADKERVIYADSSNRKKTISTSDFLGQWEGIIILIEPDNSSGEKDYSEKRRNEIINNALIPFAAVIFCMSALIGIYLNKVIQVDILDTYLISFVLFHITGLILSLLLVGRELDIKGGFTEKLCHLSTNTDCDAVTKSKASKIFGGITWADAGVTYFASGLLILFILPFQSSYLFLALLTIVAIPYPIFSILYQWLKLKKWCPLCLSVQFILILEFAVLISKTNISTAITGLNTKILISSIPVFSIVFLTVLLIKLLLVNEKQKDHIKLELKRLKRDPDIFIQKLRSGNRIDFPIRDQPLIFGETRSEVTVSVFLSLYCSSCSKVFSEILDLIKRRSKIKIELIFSSNNEEMSLKLLKSIYKLVLFNEKNEALELVDIWYKADYKKKQELLKKLNMRDVPEGFDEFFTNNAKLFLTGRVNKVPAIYVNGYPLPEIYSIVDIGFHLPEIINFKYEAIDIKV
jgi:uncharacterized membrane protein